MPHEPRQQIINESDLALDRYDGNIFVITMRRAPENRLNSKFAQKIIGAFNQVRELLGTATEGAVITKGNDAKFWCTVGPLLRSTCLKALCQISFVTRRLPRLQSMDQRLTQCTTGLRPGRAGQQSIRER